MIAAPLDTDGASRTRLSRGQSARESHPSPGGGESREVRHHTALIIIRSCDINTCVNPIDEETVVIFT